MNRFSLKTLAAFVTGICIGLAVGVTVSNCWRIDLEFGRYPDREIIYSVTVVESSTGEVAANYHNYQVPMPPGDLPMAPTLAPFDSENDLEWQAELRESADGTIEIFPAPAIRKLRRPET